MDDFSSKPKIRKMNKKQETALENLPGWNQSQDDTRDIALVPPKTQQGKKSVCLTQKSEEHREIYVSDADTPSCESLNYAADEKEVIRVIVEEDECSEIIDVVIEGGDDRPEQTEATELIDHSSIRSTVNSYNELKSTIQDDNVR